MDTLKLYKQNVKYSIKFICFFLYHAESHYKDQQDTSDLDEELKASGDKIKQIAESFALADPHFNPHRKSGGGFEDYLDEKTLARLEELKILPNTSQGNNSSSHNSSATVTGNHHHSSSKPHSTASYGDHHHVSSSSSNNRQPKLVDDYDVSGASSGPDYLEISKKV